METNYLGHVLRHNGYNGSTVILHLVEEADGSVTAVLPYGWYNYGTSVDDALGRSDVIEVTERASR